jgi:hypothetical protein
VTAELFDVEPLRTQPKPEPAGELSADRRRTRRQITRIRGGVHPLAGVAGYRLALHPDADHLADVGKPANGPTCGGCAFRLLARWHNRTYAKCAFGKPDGAALNYAPRASHSAASDCRAWWPACRDFQAAP